MRNGADVGRVVLVYSVLRLEQDTEICCGRVMSGIGGATGRGRNLIQRGSLLDEELDVEPTDRLARLGDVCGLSGGRTAARGVAGISPTDFGAMAVFRGPACPVDRGDAGT